jgi:hypothetical protein
MIRPFGDVSSRSGAGRTATVCLGGECLPAGVGFRDDLADGGFVESLPTLPALENFEVGTGSAVFGELACRLGCQDSIADEHFKALRVDLPGFGRGERLPEDGKVGERRQDLSARGLVLIADYVVKKLAFQMVESGSADRGSMECAPESDGPFGVARGQWLLEEVDVFFSGTQVDVHEQDDIAVRVFEYLRSPTGVGAGMESFPADKAHVHKELEQWLEDFAGAAVGVVVMVCPSDANQILACLLPAGGRVPGFVVPAFRFEEGVHRGTVSDQCGDVAKPSVEFGERIGFGLMAVSGGKDVEKSQACVGVLGREGSWSVFPRSASFNGHEFADREFAVPTAIGAVRCPVDRLEWEVVGTGELIDGLDAQCECGSGSVFESDSGKTCGASLPDAVSCFAGCLFQSEAFEGFRIDGVFGKDPMIDERCDVDTDGGEFAAQRGDGRVVGCEVVEECSEEEFGFGETRPGVGDLGVFHGGDVPFWPCALLLPGGMVSGWNG